MSLRDLLTRVFILGPDFLDDQLADGLSDEPRCVPRALRADGIRQRDAHRVLL